MAHRRASLKVCVQSRGYNQLMSGGGLNISGTSFSGLRSGPLDPKKKVALVGFQQEAKTMQNKLHFDQTMFVKKDRTGFGGGFKIPDEYRERKQNLKVDNSLLEEKETAKDHGLVTKEEIFAHLNLGNAETGIGSGKNG